MCAGEDSNLQALRRYYLKIVRLPISPPAHRACQFPAYCPIRIYYSLKNRGGTIKLYPKGILFLLYPPPASSLGNFFLFFVLCFFFLLTIVRDYGDDTIFKFNNAWVNNTMFAKQLLEPLHQRFNQLPVFYRIFNQNTHLHLDSLLKKVGN